MHYIAKYIHENYNYKTVTAAKYEDNKLWCLNEQLINNTYTIINYKISYILPWINVGMHSIRLI